MRRPIRWLRCALGALAVCTLAAGCVVDDEIERGDAEILPDVTPPDAMWVCAPGDVRPCDVSASCVGLQACEAGFWAGCAAAPDEACDGLDNDCDGAIDEDYADLGGGCFVGVGACERQGRFACGADNRSTVCTAEAGAATDEACNAIDDDCDGAVDEGALAPDGCPSPLTGACRAGEVRCVEGRAICAPTVEPSEEVCDGVDNDCDGITDEGDGAPTLRAPCYEGPEGTEGVGACAPGFRACRRGAFQACEMQIAPVDELCDGLDNDCDGVTDEGEDCACVPGDSRPCYPGPAGTEGVGLCLAGVQRCLPDGAGYGACVGAVLPALELCNGRDDDCDGAVDDLAERGLPCTAGRGACARDGRLECDLAIGQLACTATAGEPEDEVCNGADDDCNGRVDDVPGANTRCTDGVGGCLGLGLMVCGPGGALRCTAAAGQPEGERCNAVDDDCDDAIDEEIEGVGQACADGEGACASTGTTVCDPTLGDVVCGATPGAPAAERCNAVDDDCDGVVDEVDGIGDDCAVGVGACAAEGTRVCLPDRAVDGALICDAPAGAPQVEICNDLDDDCDGTVDEVRGLGDDCAIGLGACFSEGRRVCDLEAGALACGAGVIDPGVEICFNDVDDDCDGTVDEGPCPERCDNGIDDDFDGHVDCRDPDCAGAAGCPCGNGVLEADEQCDDGGVEPGDGCDRGCAIEGGFACAGDAPGPCAGGDPWVGLARSVGEVSAFVGAEESAGDPFVDACPAGRIAVGLDADVSLAGVVALALVCAEPARIGDRTRLLPTGATPLRGVPRDPDGGPERALCPDGAALLGLTWDTETEAIGTAALTLRCGPIAMDGDGLAIGPAADGPRFGFTFGAPATADCPDGAAAAALIGQSVAPDDEGPGGIERFAVRCDRIDPLCAGPSLCVPDEPEPDPEPEPPACPTGADGRPICADPACAAEPACQP